MQTRAPIQDDEELARLRDGDDPVPLFGFGRGDVCSPTMGGSFFVSIVH